MKKIFVLLSLIFLAVIFAVYYKSKFKSKKSPINPVLKKELNITGVIRTTGLRPEEKQKLKLDFSTYQLTNLTLTEKNKINNFLGLFIESGSFDGDKYLGKCINLTGSLKENWQNINPTKSELNNQFTYSRTAFIPSLWIEVDNNQCDPYSRDVVYKIKADAIKKYKGTLKRVERPAPDINYDYLLELNKPNYEIYDASGLGQGISKLNIIPYNNQVWNYFENNINKEIAIEGLLEYGYVESQYLKTISYSSD